MLFSILCDKMGGMHKEALLDTKGQQFVGKYLVQLLCKLNQLVPFSQGTNFTLRMKDKLQLFTLGYVVDISSKLRTIISRKINKSAANDKI